MGCCYSFYYGKGGMPIDTGVCKHLINNACNTKCIRCKMFTCRYLRKKGIKEGDIIVKMGETDVTSLAYLRYELYNHEVGETVSIEYLRDGVKKTTSIKLEGK